MFAVDGIFGPEEFGVMLDEAKQRGLPTDFVYVFCQYSTYIGDQASVRLLKDLRGPYQADDASAHLALQHRATSRLAGRNLESEGTRAVAVVDSTAPPQDSTAIDAFTKAVAAMSSIAASIADIAKAQTALLAMQAKPQEITVKLEQPASVVNVTLPEFPAIVVPPAVVNVQAAPIQVDVHVPAAQVVVNHPDTTTAEHVRDPVTQEILRTVTTHQSATRH